MRVKLAKTAGFCMGVRRAMELALSSLRGKDRPIYTYGPLIHNPQVLHMLAQNGISVLEDIPAPGSQAGGTVIIRAHGVPKEVKQQLIDAGFSKVVDGTCGRVLSVQAIISRAARQGARVVIVGDARHPEVVGLLAHAQGRGRVINSREEAQQLSIEPGQVVAVAQTTQNIEFYNEVCSDLADRCASVGAQFKVFQTICQATRQRQQEVVQLAGEVDGVVVVGGKLSANSLRLASLVRENGGQAFLVEDESDLEEAGLRAMESIGITAGASTPNWMIKRVTRHVKNMSPHSRFYNMVLRISRFVGRCQLLTGISAAVLTLVASRMQNLPLDWHMPLVALGFILAMHLINNLLESQADKYNDPEQARFLLKNQRVLWPLGISSALTALVLAFMWGGVLPFTLLMLMMAAGVIYSIPIMPQRIRARWGIGRLRDIPGSKTVALMLAWAVVTVLLPALAAKDLFISPWLLPALFYVMGLVFIKNSILDILSAQGDLFVGKETLPIAWGEKKTRRLLKIIFAAMLLVVCPVFAWLSVGLSLALTAPLIGLGIMQRNFASLYPELGGQTLLEMCLWLSALCLLV